MLFQKPPIIFFGNQAGGALGILRGKRGGKVGSDCRRCYSPLRVREIRGARRKKFGNHPEAWESEGIELRMARRFFSAFASSAEYSNHDLGERRERGHGVHSNLQPLRRASGFVALVEPPDGSVVGKNGQEVARSEKMRPRKYP
jgi:hypothetical protein